MSNNLSFLFRINQVKQKQYILTRMMKQTEQDMHLMFENTIEQMDKFKNNFAKQLQYKLSKQEEANQRMQGVAQHKNLLKLWNQHKVNVIESTNSLSENIKDGQKKIEQMLRQDKTEEKMASLYEEISILGKTMTYKQKDENPQEFQLSWQIDGESIGLILKIKKSKTNFIQDEQLKSIVLQFKAFSCITNETLKFQQDRDRQYGNVNNSYELFDRIVHNFNFHRNLDVLTLQCRQLYFLLNNLK